MQEFGLCDGIVDAALRRANGRPVRRVRVRIGILLKVGEAAFRSAFEQVAAGTSAEGATVDLAFIPARFECHTCDGVTESAAVIDVCPGCGSDDLERTHGDELVLDWVELATPAGVFG